jgi:7-cyano-7-deazaguanine synthase in queuosine biosynthesis
MGRQDSLIRKLIYIDAWQGTWSAYEIKKDDKRCPVCDERQFAFLEKGK